MRAPEADPPRRSQPCGRRPRPSGRRPGRTGQRDSCSGARTRNRAASGRRLPEAPTPVHAPDLDPELAHPAEVIDPVQVTLPDDLALDLDRERRPVLVLLA